MKRTAYFNDTKPSQDQLNYTETSKIDAILERARAFYQFGVLSGFRVIVNALNTTRVDVGVGEGFTGGHYQTADLKGASSGERIATNDGSFTVTASSLSLADYTSGAANYVTLIFSESSGTPLTERNYPFTSHDTLYAETYTASVLTSAQWAALTTTQKQSRILVAIVTARGAGVALSSTDIEQTTQPKTHPISTQPTNITGVTVEGVSQETLTGTATLSYIAASKTLRFTAPGDTMGASVAINSSGEYTVYSTTVAYYIVVNVVYALLPVANQTDTLSITSLYGRTIPLASGVDTVHRDLVGTGLVTAENPHGISLSDIQGGALSHADLFHRNGITYEADTTQLSGTILPATDSIEVVNLGGTSNTFLIDGTEFETISGYNAGTSGQISFTGETISGEFLVYLDSNANLQKVLLAEYAGGVDYVLWDDNIEIYDMFNTSAGTGTISWNSTTKVLKYRSPADVAAGYGPDVYVNALWGSVSAGYYKLYSFGLVDWVIVYVDGDLGTTNSSSFTVTKAETVVPDDSILKLCVVTWNIDHLVAGSLRDIRSFLTADNTPELLEEHDADGRHTKELHNQLRIGTEYRAFQAIVETSSAAFIQARSGSIALSVSAPNSAAVIAASKNAAAFIYGAIGTADNNQNNAAAIPVGVYGAATNIATALGRGVFGSGNSAGVHGEGPQGIVGRGNTAICASVTVSGASNVYGVVAGPGVDVTADKSLYAGFSNDATVGAGVTVKTAYGVVNNFKQEIVSNQVGFVNSVSVSSAAVKQCGFSNAGSAIYASKMYGMDLSLDASSVTNAFGIANANVISTSADAIYGVVNNVTYKGAAVGPNYFYVLSQNGSATTVTNYAGLINNNTVTNVDAAWVCSNYITAKTVTTFLHGNETSVKYDTAQNQANGMIIDMDGKSAANPNGLRVSNVVSTSVGNAMRGIYNSLRYNGAPIPIAVYGINQTMDVTNGASIIGIENNIAISSGSIAAGYVNNFYATQAQTVYGIFNAIGTGDVAKASAIYGVAVDIVAGNLGAETCVGGAYKATAYVSNGGGIFAGTVFGVSAFASMPGAMHGLACGVYGSAAGGLMRYGVVGEGFMGGVFFGTAAGGIGVSALGSNYGVSCSGTLSAGINCIGGSYGAKCSGAAADISLEHGGAVPAIYVSSLTAAVGLPWAQSLWPLAVKINVNGTTYGIPLLAI